MKRDLVRLSNNAYDLLIIGGGINGACTAWDAALRGLSVALVEKGDFGHATSSATLKLIHGGLRYLQQADFRRMRESVQERMTFMRIAPHLVHPLPFLIPTYRHLMQSKAILSLGLNMYDLLAFDRNRLEDEQKYIPRHKIVSRSECLEVEPGIDQQSLTGGVIYYDCQMHDPNRLTLSFVLSAAKAGAAVVNYTEVVGFLQKGDCVTGVKARDVLTGEEMDIRAKIVVNTTGPWSDIVLGLLNGPHQNRHIVLSKGIQIITRPLTLRHAIAIPSRHKDSNALVSRGFRHYFITPWRNHSVIGTTDVIYRGDPDDFKVTEEEIQAFIDEINESYPAAGLKREDVSFAYGGLLPIGKPARRNQIYDHQKINGVEGLVTAIGVKYTGARALAEKLIDLVFMKLRKRAPKALTAVTPVKGGQIERFDDFLTSETDRRRKGLSAEIVRHLVYHYGSEYGEILRYLNEDLDNGQRVTDTFCVIKAEILYGIREEMAQKLTDVILRRTELGTIGNPGEECLKHCAVLMATELGWDEGRTQGELEEAKAVFSNG